MSQLDVVWSGVLDVRSAGKLYAELDHLLAQDMDVHLDFTAVERVDTAVSQLLVSFQQTLIAHAHQVLIKGVPERVREDWKLLDLFHLIESN